METSKAGGGHQAALRQPQDRIWGFWWGPIDMQGQGAWVSTTIPTICSKQNRSRIRREPACRTCIRASNGVVTVTTCGSKEQVGPQVTRVRVPSHFRSCSLFFRFVVVNYCLLRAQCVSHVPTGGM